VPSWEMKFFLVFEANLLALSILLQLSQFPHIFIRRQHNILVIPFTSFFYHGKNEAAEDLAAVLEGECTKEQINETFN
jgi:hypothetical protein